MKSLSNFRGSALSRAEMKNVSGGLCYYKDAYGGPPYACFGAKDCQQQVQAGWGTRWCCDSCSTASWCQGC